jgi:3-oxoacyl-[acyl-carrier protein] reductase
MNLGIEGKLALVTGGSAGIGLAIAKELAAEGCTVAVSSRSREKVEAAAAQAGGKGFVWDAADVDGAGPLVDEVESSLGAPVDILVCNTGGPPAGDPFAFPREEWEAAYRTLVLAPVALVERCSPSMRERKWGRILNVVSTTVREPSPFLLLSNAHRAATVAAWKTYSRLLAPDGVTINSVLPGRIGTERLGQLFGSIDNAAEAAASEVPAGRLGTVEEMAAGAVFLCSDRASYITGVALLIDGGLTHAI